MNHLNLTAEEYDYLEHFTRKATQNVREVNRAYILLWLDKGKKMGRLKIFWL